MGLATYAALGCCAAFGGLPVQAQPKNPFLEQKFYVNPANSEEFDESVATASGKTKENLEFMQNVPSAYWIDIKEKLHGRDTRSLEGILMDASSKSTPELVVVIWYDLPNRDCDAKASNGEMCCYPNPDGTCNYEKTGDCSEGLERYKSEYVDPFISILKRYQDRLPIVIVLEPDSLANLATNTGHPHCGNLATQTSYKQGVKYAMGRLTAEVPSVSVYLDAAHGGWIGWENNLEKFMAMLKDLTLPFGKIRGFATNVANYQPLGIQCPWCPDQGYRNGYCLNGRHQDEPCCDDPCKLESQYNFGNNELNYAAGLVAAANANLGMDAHVIIDTGRNGVTDQRMECADWCNPRGAGAGVPSTTDTANRTLVDAYFWLKTPGESDGCSETLPNRSKCVRFDSGCASVDSLGATHGEPHAPEAGHWFDYQVKQLAANAHFAKPPRIKDTNLSEACPNTGFQPPPVTIQPSGGSASTGGSSQQGTCIEAWRPCNSQGSNNVGCCQGCSCVGASYSQCTPSISGSACLPGGLIGQTPAPATTSTFWAWALATTASPRTTTAQPWFQAAQPSSTDGPPRLFSAAGALPGEGGGASAPAQPGVRGSLVPAIGSPFAPRSSAPYSTSTALPAVASPVTYAPPVQLATASPVTYAPPAQPHTASPSVVSSGSTSGTCSKAYAQCGGKVGYHGPTCCEGSCKCTDYGGGGYYLQCVPAPGQSSCTSPQTLSENLAEPVSMAKERRLSPGMVSWAVLCSLVPPALVVLWSLWRARARSGAPGAERGEPLYDHLG